MEHTMSETGSAVSGSGFSLTVKDGDLFSAPASASLAHCISRDCRLGKGIAKLFRERFGRIQEIQDCRAGVGEIAVLQDGARFIYNLVTKELYHGKPTYETLRRSLEKMKEHAIRHGVKEICMPKIGCGLDQLQWPAVRTLIKNVFQQEQIHITIYALGGEENKEDNHHKGGQAKEHRTPKKDKAASEKERHGHKTDKKDPKKPIETQKKEQKQTSVKDYFAKNSGKLDKTEASGEGGRSGTGKDETKPDSGRKVEVGFGFRTTNPLPDVFCGMRIHVEKTSPDYELLRRGVIGLGGQAVETPETATHLVYTPGTQPF